MNGLDVKIHIFNNRMKKGEYLILMGILSEVLLKISCFGARNLCHAVNMLHLRKILSEWIMLCDFVKRGSKELSTKDVSEIFI